LQKLSGYVLVCVLFPLGYLETMATDVPQTSINSVTSAGDTTPSSPTQAINELLNCLQDAPEQRNVQKEKKLIYWYTDKFTFLMKQILKHY
jgi:hypothetical protein